MLASLPQELFLIILEYLKGERDDLKSCSLVCQGWRVPFQAPIFHSIVLDLETDIACRSLRSILVTSPHIVPLIRNLTIHTPSDFLVFEPENTVTITSTLLLLEHLESLTLSMRYTMVWHQLPLVLRDTISKTIGLASLSSLILKHWNFRSADLQRLLMYGHSLKSVSLLDIEFQDAEFPDKPARLREPAPYKHQIEALTVGPNHVEEWLCDPYCSLSLTNLRSLKCEWSVDLTCISRLLAIAGQSLEKLDITIAAEPPSIDLSQNSGLRSISLNWSSDFDFKPADCPPQWLELSLSTIHPTARIEELVLQLSFEIAPQVQDYPDAADPAVIRNWDYSKWRRLRPYFTSDERFSSLRKVKLEVECRVEDAELFEYMVPYKDIAIRESGLANLDVDLSFQMSHRIIHEEWDSESDLDSDWEHEINYDRWDWDSDLDSGSGSGLGLGSGSD